MKHFIPSLIALCIAMSGPAFGQPQDDARRSLENSVAAFYDAVARGDALARVALLDTGAILMPNGSGLIQGKENVSRVFTADTGSAVFQIKDRRLISLVVADSLAYTVNSYYYTWHRKGEQPVWRKTKNVHLWRRQPNGTWKLSLDIWNSDTPVRFKQD